MPVGSDFSGDGSSGNLNNPNNLSTTNPNIVAILAIVAVVFCSLIAVCIIYTLRQSPALEKRVYPLLQSGMILSCLTIVTWLVYIVMTTNKDSSYLPFSIGILSVLIPMTRILQYTRIFILQNTHAITEQKLKSATGNVESVALSKNTIMPSQLYLLRICGFNIKHHTINGVQLLAIDTRVPSIFRAFFQMGFVYVSILFPVLLCSQFVNPNDTNSVSLQMLPIVSFEMLCAFLGIFSIIKISQISASHYLRSEHVSTGIINIIFTVISIVCYAIPLEEISYVFLAHSLTTLCMFFLPALAAHIKYKFLLLQYVRSRQRMKLPQFRAEISNPAFREYIRPYLAKDLCLENLAFVETYIWANNVIQKQEAPSNSQELCEVLYNDFIPYGSLNELNIMYGLRSKIQQKHANYTLDASSFDEVYDVVVASIYFNTYMRRVATNNE